MIIYGSRMYGRRNLVNGWGHCEYCGKYGRNTSYNGRKWGHLYFIPLIPEGPRVRVIKECKKCSHGTHIAERDVPAILGSLHESTEKALAALLAGEKEFDNNGTTTPSTACLAGAVEMLVCLQSDKHLRLILAALQEKELTHAHRLVQGELLEFEGKLDEAAEAYQLAADCEPDDVVPLLSVGSIHLKKNEYQKARLTYEKALALSEDRLPVLQVLLTIYESLKEHARLAETYEECFERVPELTDDKKIVSAYKKACKKAGRQPVA